MYVIMLGINLITFFIILNYFYICFQKLFENFVQESFSMVLFLYQEKNVFVKVRFG